MLNKNINDTLMDMAKFNCHIHTILSPCASRDMTLSAIVKTADRLDLESITITDHNHPGDRHLEARIKTLASELQHLPEHKVEVVIGAELSAYGINRFGDTWSESRAIPARLYACNHYHLKTWEQPRIKSVQGYKEHSLYVLKKLFASGRATSIAHPLIGGYLVGRLDDFTQLTASYTDAELCNIFEAARRHNVIMEINTRHLLKDLEFARRFITLGFESRCKLQIGTDAHSLPEINSTLQTAELIKKLS